MKEKVLNMSQPQDLNHLHLMQFTVNLLSLPIEVSVFSCLKNLNYFPSCKDIIFLSTSYFVQVQWRCWKIKSLHWWPFVGRLGSWTRLHVCTRGIVGLFSFIYLTKTQPIWCWVSMFPKVIN